MSVIAILYWVWFGVSIVVLARRAVRRMSARSSRSVTVAPRLAERLLEPPTIDVAPAASGERPTEDHAVEAPALPAPSAPMWPAAVATARDASDAPDAPDAPAKLAGTVFAPRPIEPPAPSRSSSAGLRVTLADALEGIRMPADLAPLVNVEGADGTRRAVFATSGRSIEIVGAAVAEELARLGFALEALGPSDALAKRGDDALAVRLRTIGPAPKKGPADPMYPTAPAGAVVVDVELT